MAGIMIVKSKLYNIEMCGSAGHTPQEQDEEYGLLISITRMEIILVIIGLSYPPPNNIYKFLIYKYLNIYIYYIFGF